MTKLVLAHSSEEREDATPVTIRHKGKKVKLKDLSFTFEALDDEAAAVRSLFLLRMLTGKDIKFCD